MKLTVSIYFIKFIFYGGIKTIFNLFIYYLLFSISNSEYLSLGFAYILTLAVSYLFNSFLIFNANTINLNIFSKQFIISIFYLIASYLIAFILGKLDVNSYVKPIFISILLIYPNFYVTKYIFKK